MFGAIIIGDEILSGKREDRHFARAIALLGERGLALAWAQYLGDEPERITATLERTFVGGDIVFCFGGIGATPDDHTRQCAAAALKRPLVRHPGAVREIEARFGEAAHPHRIRMAEFPEGASIIPNPVNRIAAFSVERHHFLPGFPEMAAPMMAWVLDTVYPHLRRDDPPVEVALRVRGAGEGDLVDLMNRIVREFPDLRLASLPSLSTGAASDRLVELSVRGRPERAREAAEILRAGIAQLGYFIEEPRR